MKTAAVSMEANKYGRASDGLGDNALGEEGLHAADGQTVEA